MVLAEFGVVDHFSFECVGAVFASPRFVGFGYRYIDQKNHPIVFLRRKPLQTTGVLLEEFKEFRFLVPVRWRHQNSSYVIVNVLDS